MENQLAPAFQLRLVDLPGAFAQRPWPAEVAGSLTIGVADPQADWNHGVWRIAFEAGRATVDATSIDSPDLVASIEVWSQLFAGSITPLQAVRLGRLRASNPAALALMGRATAGDPFFFFDLF